MTALRIKVIPAKATRSHKRAVVTCASKGKLKLIGDEGEVEEVEDESSPVPDDGDVGTSTPAMLISETLIQAVAGLRSGGCSVSGGLAFRGAFAQATSSATTSDETVDEPDDCPGGGENLILLLRQKGTSTDDLVIRASLQSTKIDERLARIVARLEASGKTEQLAKVVQRADEQKARVEARLQ